MREMSKETQAETSRELETSARHDLEQAEETYCSIIELRQYIHHLGKRDEFIALFDEYFIENTMIPLLRSAGATLLGYFVTEPAENTYPDLPVREEENVFVWLASFADEAAYSSYYAALAQNQEWITSIVPALHMWGASFE